MPFCAIAWQIVNHILWKINLYIADSSVGWFNLSFQPVPEGVLILSMDITKRKHAQEALHAADERFRQVMQQVNDVVWRASLDGSRIYEISPAFETIYGLSVRDFELNPNLWLEMVHPDDKSIAEASSQDLLKKGQSTSEYRILRPDGSISWLLDRKSILSDGQGNPVQIGGVATDITRIKQRDRERETLLSLATALRTAATRAEMLPIILDQVILLIGLDGAAFALLDDVHDEIVVELARGGLARSNQLRIPPGEGITAKVLLSGKTYVTSNLGADPNNYHSDLFHGFTYAACVPLIADEKVIGALWVSSQSKIRDADLHLLEGVADMAATAIYRSALFEQTVQYAQQITEAYERNIEGWSAAPRFTRQGDRRPYPACY